MARCITSWNKVADLLSRSYGTICADLYKCLYQGKAQTAGYAVAGLKMVPELWHRAMNETRNRKDWSTVVVAEKILLCFHMSGLSICCPPHAVPVTLRWIHIILPHTQRWENPLKKVMSWEMTEAAAREGKPVIHVTPALALPLSFMQLFSFQASWFA